MLAATVQPSVQPNPKLKPKPSPNPNPNQVLAATVQSSVQLVQCTVVGRVQLVG